MGNNGALRTVAAAAVTVAWIIILGFLMIQIQNANDGIITDIAGNPIRAITPRDAWEYQIAMAGISAVLAWVFYDRFSPPRANGSTAPLWGSTLTLFVVMLLALFIGQPQTELGQRTNAIVLQWLIEGALSVAAATVLGILITWNIVTTKNKTVAEMRQPADDG